MCVVSLLSFCFIVENASGFYLLKMLCRFRMKTVDTSFNNYLFITSLILSY